MKIVVTLHIVCVVIVNLDLRLGNEFDRNGQFVVISHRKL